MERYLVSLTIGPVQGFIAAARRTRDLWFGSELLSEVSKAAARALRQQGAELIFPAPPDDRALDPKSDFNVANRIVAEAFTADPRGLLEAAAEAAWARWHEYAEQAWRDAGRLLPGGKAEEHLRRDIWDRQVDDVLESFSAWVPVAEGDYGEARRRLDRVAASRKATRDFGPLADGPADPLFFGLPKSSLDGARETVLKETLNEEKKTSVRRLRRRLRLGDGEQLDCTGLVKRLSTPKSFAPTTRIALDPWLRRIEGQGEGRLLAPVKAALEPLANKPEWDLVTRVTGNGRIYEALPYDGSLLYDFRLAVAERDAAKLDEPELPGLLKPLREAVRPFYHDSPFGRPCPYLAVLLADGDRMGELLDKAQDAAGHRDISSRLARFAAAVPGIVRDHRGHCVYAGGDDVLALVPLDRAVACARALHDAFGEALKPVSTDTVKPTLSVGIGIGHMQEHLGRLRALAKRAERLAKGDTLKDEEAQRNGLAIIVRPRSGAELEWRDRWDNDPDRRLEQWMKLHEDEVLPDKAAYELRAVATALAGLEDGERKGLEEAEAERILDRKRGERGRTEIPKVDKKKLLAQAGLVGLAKLADELVVARWLTAHVTE